MRKDEELVKQVNGEATYMVTRATVRLPHHGHTLCPLVCEAGGRGSGVQGGSAVREICRLPGVLPELVQKRLYRTIRQLKKRLASRLPPTLRCTCLALSPCSFPVHLCTYAPTRHVFASQHQHHRPGRPQESLARADLAFDVLRLVCFFPPCCQELFIAYLADIAAKAAQDSKRKTIQLRDIGAAHLLC